MSSVHRICGDFVRLYFPKLRTRIGYGDGVNFILFRIKATFDYSIYSSFQPNYHQAKSERHETFPLNLTHSNFIDAIHDSFVRFWLPMLFNMKLSDEHCPPDWKMFLRYSGFGGLNKQTVHSNRSNFSLRRTEILPAACQAMWIISMFQFAADQSRWPLYNQCCSLKMPLRTKKITQFNCWSLGVFLASPVANPFVPELLDQWNCGVVVGTLLPIEPGGLCSAQKQTFCFNFAFEARLLLLWYVLFRARIYLVGTDFSDSNARFFVCFGFRAVRVRFNSFLFFYSFFYFASVGSVCACVFVCVGRLTRFIDSLYER